MIYHGDCLEVLRTLPDASVDAVVTDPPYGLAFMGKRWDYDVPSTDVWAECLRVLKPGGHLLAFAGTRTQHRMAVRIEDAGFEIRDMIAWVYGSGFPKSLDVSKAIDKAAGAEREVIGPKVYGDGHVQNNTQRRNQSGRYNLTLRNGVDPNPVETAPATEAARQWQGWGTALKPAMEPITVARKPLVGTVAENVLAHGTGALNVDACRVGTSDDCARKPALVNDTAAGFGKGLAMGGRGHDQGRWPANMIHDGSDEVVADFPETSQQGSKKLKDCPSNTFGGGSKDSTFYGDKGSAARFFYCAKTSKRERGEGNTHPTVKPITLMRYLCRLVTPPGGTVLDPFMGSGSTGKAAILEGFSFIGIEREAEYVEIAKARIASAQAQPKQESLF